MISNLKVDIIYYKTSSDFELEFNLNGCCRMRIFKEKVDNQKSLINTLARDVSRSRVIILVTDLIGEKNGVEIVSSAIGYKYEPVDKMAHSIKSGDNIKAPHGCLPLVTKSGQYGGCIVECGKQSIIIVTSDRPLRHEIMRSYIHQYIFDINQVEAYNERLRHENEHNPIIDQSNILNSARQEFAPMVMELSDHEAHTDGAATENDGIAEGNEASTDEAVGLEAALIEVDKPVENSVNQDINIALEEPADENADTVSSDDDTVIRSSSEGFVAMLSDVDEDTNTSVEQEPRVDRRLTRRNKGTNITLLVITILLLVCFGVLAYYFVYLPIIEGELPNDISKILQEVFKWTK